MRYAGLKENDCVNGEGVIVSLWMQGCPHHCKGCFNQETWDMCGGAEIAPSALTSRILKAIPANGIRRNFSVLGGEPLCEQNRECVWDIVSKVRQEYPDIKIFIWSGYTIEELKAQQSDIIKKILYNIDMLIDGRFVEELKDLTLKWRGSSNQRLLNKEEIRKIYDELI